MVALMIVTVLQATKPHFIKGQGCSFLSIARKQVSTPIYLHNDNPCSFTPQNLVCPLFDLVLEGWGIVLRVKVVSFR